MKKALIIIAVMLGFAAVASAQPKAIGARLVGFGAFGMEASYQHYSVSDHFFEVDLGLDYNQDGAGFKVSAGHNWVFAEPDWTSRGTWQWYAGPGFTTGAVHYGDVGTKFMFGLFGQVGLEYTFSFPLQLSADVRPTFAVCNGDFYGSHLLNTLVPTVSVRYHF